MNLTDSVGQSKELASGGSGAHHDTYCSLIFQCKKSHVDISPLFSQNSPCAGPGGPRSGSKANSPPVFFLLVSSDMDHASAPRKTYETIITNAKAGMECLVGIMD